MEDALAPHRAPPGLLPADTAPAALVLTRRRSHLDSASYRTLSRLFSHCLHLHPLRHAASTYPDAEPAAANPTGDSVEAPNGGSAPTKNAGFDRGKDFEDWAAADAEPAAANPSADLGVAPQSSPEREVAGVERLEGVEEMVVAGLSGGTGLVGEDEALKSVKACLEKVSQESVEELVCNNEQLLLDATRTDFSRLIDVERGSTMSAQSCGTAGVEPQNDGMLAEVKKLRGGIGEDRPVGNLDLGLIDGGGFEEGEIEGDMQDLNADESDDSELEDEDTYEKLQDDFVIGASGEIGLCDHDAKNQNLHLMPKIKGNNDVLSKETNIKDDLQMHVARAQAISYDDVVDWNETPLAHDETNKPGKKRKRHLTEERKAKKTMNKRKKRAQQRIADGVNKLKLQPVIKPKVVQYCRFYMQGKCQQGSICKFSHDITPLTKSKPCTHFARNSCLKGDDCPYDHELSKYPCHHFMEKGMCPRGGNCKFSHVMPKEEVPSAPDAKKSDASLVSEKAIQREQTISQKNSMVYNGEPVTSVPTKHHSIFKNIVGISVNAQKTSASIPKGVRFLPFSQDTSDCSILHQDAFSIEKDRYTNGGRPNNFGGPQPVEGKKIVKQNGQSLAPLFAGTNISKEVTLHPCSELNKTSLPSDSTAVPGSASTQAVVSEASRILQEFLFGPSN